VLSAPTPDHSGTDDDRKGGPLWLRLQGYVLPVTLCQDHLRVLTTGVLVSTQTGFHPQVSRGVSTASDGGTAGDGASCAISSEVSLPFPGFGTVVPRPSTGWVVRSCGSVGQTLTGLPGTPAS
jgi:hypothetical protein